MTYLIFFNVFHDNNVSATFWKEKYRKMSIFKGDIKHKLSQHPDFWKIKNMQIIE